MKLQVYENAELGSVRTVMLNEEVYFVGKDVVDILEYQNGSRDIKRHVDVEDRLKIMVFDGNQDKETIVINESGLYSLILSSKMPKAKVFKRWVTSEVLPSIRKHGMYMVDDLIKNPDLAIKAFLVLKEEREKNKTLSEMIAVQNQQIVEMKPKVSYYDVVLNCKDLISITKIAKDYGKSAIWLNSYLHDKGIQFKQGDIWLLYQGYAENGYTSTKTHSYLGSDGTQHSKVHTYWTQKGRLFIYSLLKADGIIPIIERIS